MRKLLPGLAVALATLLGLSAAAEAAPRERPGQGGGAIRIKADRDRDKVLDELEERLVGKPDEERVSVIVMLRAPASAQRVDALERAAGRLEGVRRFSIVDGFAATASKRQVRALAALGAVAHVEENSPVHALNHTAQQAFGVSEARLDAPGLDGDRDGNAATYSPADLVAAVIDTGIHATHADLDEGKVLAFRDFVNGRTTPYDDEGHGTHVAGTIAGDGDALASHEHQGVAPAAGLVGIKVLDRRGDGTEADVVAGIQWAVDNKALYGIEVVNLSLGIAGCSDGNDASSIAANNARNAGLVVAVAAGNEGPGTCTIGAPGAAANAITVGAMADFGARGFYQAYFSSRGKTADGRIKPDVSGPGVEIASAQAGTTTGYIDESGTSMATPFVAGLSLLMLDANAALTPDAVKQRIRGTALDWGRGGDNRTPGTSGADIDYGAGRLDAYAALGSAGALLTSPPPVPVHLFREGSLSGTGDQDEYPIAVTDTSFPIAATMIMPDVLVGSTSTPDFDIFLFDPSGAQVASSEFTTRQEDVGFTPTVSGTYKLRVTSFRGAGNYFVDISAPRPSGFPRPQAAVNLRVPLAIAYQECSASNRVHGPGLTGASCNPARPASTQLTVGTLDANGHSSRNGGSARLTAACNPPAPGSTPPCSDAGDQADVRLDLSLTDVRRQAGLIDYTGELQGVITLRITDRSNGASLSESGTVQNLPFSFTVPCAPTSTGDVGSTCSVATYADAVTAGAVPEGKRSNWEIARIEVLDGGPDGLATTGPNEPFARQGIFIP